MAIVSREIKAGIIIIAAIAFFVWGYSFLKGKDLFEKTYTYFAIYDRVDGLMSSAPVYVNGLKVGNVGNISFVNDSNRKVIIEIKVVKEFLIPQKSVAEIYSADLMGSRAIRIILSNEQKCHLPNDTLRSSLEADLKSQVSAQVLPLKHKAEELIKSIDSVMTVVQSIFDRQTRYNITRSIENIRLTLENLVKTSVTLDTLVQSEKYALTRIIANIESITENLRNNNELINNVMKNLSAVSDSLMQANIKQTVLNANKALYEASLILDKINKGEGSLGMLIYNDQLYKNLESSSKNLDLLLRDLRENPKRYVHFSLFDFGRTVILEDNEKNRKKYKQQEKSKEDTIISYRIQIKSSKHPIPMNSREFKGFDNIQETFVEGWYKYTIGNFSNKEEAVQYKSQISHAFPDAFVVAFVGHMPVVHKKNITLDTTHVR